MINKELKIENSIQIKASAKEVWDALVNPEKIKVYFFGTQAESEWEKGSSLTFRGEWEGTSYVDKGTILEIEPLRVLKYDYISSFSSLDDKPENYSIITNLLESDGEHTTLTIIQEGFENEDARKHSINNWDALLKAIKEMIEGSE
ncbi:MAG: SRPBCC domain-containing protein [Marinoscillum sp.]